MAETMSKLMLRIGLSFDELNRGFIQAESTLKQNMARLGRENSFIDLKLKVDLASLNSAKDAVKALELQEQALTQKIENQKARLQLSNVAWKEATQRTGEHSKQAMGTARAVEQERLKLILLEQELKRVGDQQKNLSANQSVAQFESQQKKIKNYIARVNDKNMVIKLRSEVDIASLDKLKDSSKILEIQAKSLNQQLKNQQSIVRATEKVLRETSTQTGKFSSETLKAAANVEREKLALKQLETELRAVANEQKRLTDQQNTASNSNKLLSGYQGLKGNITEHLSSITSAFTGIQTASQSADGAITKSLEIIGSIPHPVGQAVAALASIPLVFKGVENSIINAAKSAAAAGDSVYVMSRGFQMSVADTAKFTTNCKVAGVEVNDLAMTVKRLQQSVLKAGSSGNAMTQMLQHYGVSIYDASGHLKNLNDMTMALSQGLKKAQAEGNGAAFVLTAFRNASGDAITAIEDWADVNEQAATIVKNGLANPALAHSVQGNINAMNVQAAQLNASFASVLLPIANEIIPRVTTRMGDLTRFLAENKDEIKVFGVAVGKFFGSIEDGADIVFSSIGKVVRALKELKIDDKQKELELSLSFNLNPDIEKYKQTLKSYDLANPAYFAPMLKNLDLAKEKTEKFAETIKDANKELKNMEQIQPPELIGGGGISAAIERSANDDVINAKIEESAKVLKIERETNKILYDINHTELEKRKNDLIEWWREVSTAQNTSNEERVAYEKQYHAKLEQLDNEYSKKVNAIREEIATKQRTDLENQIATIEKNKEEWIQAGIERTEAEKAAEQQKYETIKSLEEEFTAARDSLYQNELEKRLAQIEKEKQAWIKKGIDEVRATQLAEQQKVEAQRNAAMNVLKSQLKEWRIYQNQGLEGLKKYQLGQLHKSGISDRDLEAMTSQSLQDFLTASKSAMDSLLPNFQNVQQPVGEFNDSIKGMANVARESVIPVSEMLESIKQTTQPLAEIKNNLAEIAPPIADFQEKFNGISESVMDLPNKFVALGESVTALTDIFNKLPELQKNKDDEKVNQSSNVAEIDTSIFKELQSAISETGNMLNTALTESQNKMNEVTNKLAEAMSIVNRADNSLSAVKTALDKVAGIKVSTPTVNVTQNINEPHAWDNGLIRELANKVADNMKYEIINALKSSYSY